MLVNSGNGYHLYLKLNKSKVVTEENLEAYKQTYKKVVKDIDREIKGYSGGTISLDDRKDIAGILRVPGTTNTKANKKVSLVEINTEGENKWLTYLWGKYLRDTNKKIKYFNENKISLSDSLKGINLPKDIEELVNSPLIKLVGDNNLEQAQHGNWHSTVVFAIQALIYHSGLTNHAVINELSMQYNRKFNASVDFSVCSKKDEFNFPIRRAIWFCKKNGYNKYAKEIEDLYLKNN